MRNFFLVLGEFLAAIAIFGSIYVILLIGYALGY